MKSGDALRYARFLRSLLDASDVDPNSEEAELIEDLHLVGRHDLAGMLEEGLAAEGARRIRKNLVFGRHEEDLPGEILIGTSTDTDQDGGDVRLALQDLRQTNSALFGSIGKGKSRLLKYIIEQITEPANATKCVVWLFDAEGEHHDIPGVREGRILHATPDMLRIPLFRPWGDAQRWLDGVCEILRGNEWMGEGSLSILKQLATELFRDCGTLEGSRRFPTLMQFEAAVRQLRITLTSRKGGWHETLCRALGNIRSNLGGTLEGTDWTRLDELLAQHVIFDVSGLDAGAYELFVCLLLLATQEMPQGWHRLIVLEESHLILNPARRARTTTGDPWLEQAFRKMRKRGTTFLIVDQTPSQVPLPVLATTGARVVLPLHNHRCVQVVGDIMGLNTGQRDALPRLQVRHALAQLPRVPSPLLVRIPELPSLIEPDREHLRRTSEQRIRSITVRGPQPEYGTNQQSGGESRGGHGSQATGERGAAASPTRRQGSRPGQWTRSTQGQEAKPRFELTIDEVRVLKRIGSRPEETVEQRTQKLELSDRYAEGRRRKRLITLGLVEDVLKVGKMIYWAITGKGREELARRGFQIRMPKSGWRHEIALRLVTTNWKKADERWAWRINVGAIRSRQCDALGKLGELTIGLQISDTNKPHYEAQAALDLAGELDLVVIVCIDPKKVGLTRAAIARERKESARQRQEEEMQRVRFTSLKEAVSEEFDLVDQAR